MDLFINSVVITEIVDNEPLMIMDKPEKEIVLPSQIKYTFTNTESDCSDCKIDSFYIIQEDEKLFSHFFLLENENLKSIFIKKMFNILLSMTKKIV